MKINLLKYKTIKTFKRSKESNSKPNRTKTDKIHSPSGCLQYFVNSKELLIDYVLLHLS